MTPPQSSPVTAGLEPSQVAYHLDVPDDIERVRERLFHANDAVASFPPDRFDRIWPFVDNLWLRTGTGRDIAVTVSNPLEKHTYNCPWRIVRRESKGSGLRARTISQHEKCGALMYVLKEHLVADGRVQEEVVQVLVKVVRGHNHSMEDRDQVKINGAIRDALKAWVRGYHQGHVRHASRALDKDVQSQRILRAAGLCKKLTNTHIHKIVGPSLEKKPPTQSLTGIDAAAEEELQAGRDAIPTKCRPGLHPTIQAGLLMKHEYTTGRFPLVD